jgi:polyisoprenoid-binding protein YceI
MKPLKEISAIFLLFALFASNSYKAQTSNKPSHLWKVTTYTISFKIKNAKLNVDGAFGGLEAKIQFDPNKNENNSLEAKISPSTIKTGNGVRDNHLKKSEYFNVEKFPEIHLKSSTITKLQEGQYSAKCILTIKGKSQEITLPFSFSEKDNKALFNGNFFLNRLDFGVGSSSIILANNLQVFIAVNGLKS